MPEFPSVEWFEAVRECANTDSQFTSQGTVNCVMGVKAGDAAFVLTFEGFECAAVKATAEGELRDLDFYIDMSPAEWRELLDNIAVNGGADSAHTLNTLDLTIPSGCVKSGNELRRAAFFQYQPFAASVLRRLRESANRVRVNRLGLGIIAVNLVPSP